MTTPSANASNHAELHRIGRFCISNELGRGTVGCVHLGHDPVLGRDVAIKTFNPTLSAIEKIRFEQQFINEARAAARLSHQNIVTIYDASSEGGTTYIAMEYLQGRELSRMLDEGHRYLPHEAASIAWRIADALEHAHQRGVIHRDIKPANIFMVKDNQPKLIDFGIARAPNRVPRNLVAADAYTTIMAGDRLLGTPNYMSPEQAQSDQVDARTDIYSLGAVMYEMLTGRKPFQAADAEKLLQQIAVKTPTAPHKIDPAVPAALSRIVMQAMSKRPEQRYLSAESMALDIKRYLLKERRARKRLQIAVEAAERNEPQDAPLPRRGLHWFAYGSGVLLLAAAGAKLLA
jgi:serine/threonine protein kinase